MVGTASSHHRSSVAETSGVAGIVTDIRAAVAACRLCPKMAPHHKSPPGSFGTTSTRYMLVGSVPEPGGRVFRDAAGTVLREALAAVDDPRYRELEDLFFLTHAARCVPMHSKVEGKVRPPSVVECRTCRPYLDFEMRALHPRLVIAIGGKAAESVLGCKVKIEQVHRERHRLRTGEALTLVTPSPHSRATLKRLDLTIESYRRWLTGLFGALIDDLDR